MWHIRSHFGTLLFTSILGFAIDNRMTKTDGIFACAEEVNVSQWHNNMGCLVGFTIMMYFFFAENGRGEVVNVESIVDHPSHLAITKAQKLFI